MTQLALMPTWLYFSRPSNIAFHNLCTNIHIPAHIRLFLGLGLNFCLKVRTNQGPNAVDYDRFRRDIYTKVFFAGKESTIPPLFIRSNWEPPSDMIPNEVKMLVRQFLLKLQDIHVIRNKHHSINLLPAHKAALRFLKNEKQLLVIKADKNLGPVLIERTRYIQYAYKDHLSNRQIYRSLSKKDILNRMQAIRNILQHLLTTHFSGKANKYDRKVLDHHLQLYQDKWTKNNDPPFVQMYLLAKVHKTPLTTRPIISVSGTILYGLGRWIDFKLQSLIKSFPKQISILHSELPSHG